MERAESQGAVGAIAKYFKDFGVLRDNPFEYWLVQFINLCHSAGYFALLAICTLFFTENLGLDDVWTGYVVTGMTVGTTLCLLVSGAVTDSLGIKKSLLIAIGMQTVLWAIVTTMGLWESAPGRVWIGAAAFILMAPGMAMTITVFQSSNRRFSSKRSRSASFSLWYLMMNLGGVIAGYVIVDGVRLSWNLDNSYIFGIAAALGALSMLAILLVRKEGRVVGKGEDDEDGEAASEVKKLSFTQNLKLVVRQKPFWQLVVLLISILGVRAVFSYMYLLMPKYWERIIGEDVAMGMLQAINPICIVVGIIITLPIISRFNVFKMLVFGAIISSFSLLVLMFPHAWFGPNMADSYFRMSVASLIILSIGEVFWSPKLNEYSAAIAPKGMEGTYLGMSMLPWFVAKTAVSFLSGHMLVKWCPEGIGEKIAEGELTFWETPEAMWMILFIWAISGVAIAIIFRKWLTRGADLDPSNKAEKAAA